MQTKKGKAGVNFFKVPQDPRWKKNWDRACGMELPANSLICSLHFDESHLIVGAQRTHLMPNAVPTFYIASRLTASTECQFVGATTVRYDDLYSGGPSPEVLPFLQQKNDVFAIKQQNISQTSCYTQTDEECVEQSSCDTQTDAILLECSMELEMYALREENRKLRNENASLKQKIAENSAIILAMKSIFTEGQIKKMLFRDKSVRWKWNDISKAICLHASGPRAYRHMYQNGFPLPHVSTLQRWSQKVPICEGVLDRSLDLMRNISELSAQEKVCVLAFDEMKVAELYEYDPTGGFVRKPAKLVQVVMARGLYKSWKQPVFYDFDCKITVEILSDIIMSIQGAGFPVVAIVSDMGSTNQKLWRDLGVTIDRPWFPNPMCASEKMFAFADPPHLLKLIRNHYLHTGLIWNGKIINSRAIVDVMKHTSDSDMSITYKLKEEHLTVKSITKQKVKLAAQLLSSTTANAIRRCHDIGKEVCNPVETADLIQLVNDWFAIVNSSVETYNYPGKEAFGLNLSHQKQILQRMDDFMSGVVIPRDILKEKRKKKKKKRKEGLEQFQQGVLLTTRALPMLFEYLQLNYNFEYIATRRLNQDLLEHFFGTMRSSGGLNDHPTPKEFRYRLRKYILARNTKNLSNTGNVEQDSTEWLNTSYSHISHIEPNPTEPNETEAEDPDVVEALSGVSINGDIGVLQEDALAYLAGYIIRKQNLKEHEDANSSSFPYTDLVSKGLLKKPSEHFYNGIKCLETVFNNVNGNDIAPLKNLKQHLIDQSAYVDLPETVKLFFFKCRIFFRVRDLNNRLKEKKAAERIKRLKKFKKVIL